MIIALFLATTLFFIFEKTARKAWVFPYCTTKVARASSQRPTNVAAKTPWTTGAQLVSAAPATMTANKEKGEYE